ncbi:hypothetical protein FHS55_003837 [Angulomicrobium tetraedrale]|uniref:Exopolysaccharide biosynthesis protein n=1 Tax=Ancylobacter tetraedralis TaxID=217068 RepID=A0A839ZEX1_9HYPH|nr:hypothetical protein [Ancylobacter tetraedralis]
MQRDLSSDEDAPGAEEAPPDDTTRLSQILNRIASDSTQERIAIGDFLRVLQERAFGPLLLIFALPNVIPTPPGTSTVLGAPLVFLTLQLALGRSPWLPPLISRRSIARKDFAAFVAKATPWLARAERLLRPRLGLFAHPPAEYLVGFICFVLAVVLILPIPLGNMLPALAICILALGILERDGIWILIGAVVAIASLGLVSGVIWAFMKAGLYLLHSFIG